MKMLKRYIEIARKPKLSLLLVTLSYVFFTAFYMGPSVWDCNNTLYGFGDNTAGPVWRFGLEPDQAPLGSFQNITNYPVGENLYTPAVYSLSGQSYAIWASSKALGPICGYNAFNMAGFVVSALVMFGFILSISRNRWLAWIAGYAVSFSPYYQMKVGGHPGYGYQALLIAIAWAVFNLIKKQRKRDAGYLAAITAVCFYFDPYFSLLGLLVLVPLLITWLLVSLYRRRNNTLSNKKFIDQLKLFGLSAGVFFALILPLVGVTLKNLDQINSSVAAVRGNVLAEAKACSNLPHEYVLPYVLHPVFTRVFDEAEYVETIDYLHDNFSCGIGEDTVGISLIILSVTFTGIGIFAWEKLNKRKLGIELGYDKTLVIAGMMAIGLVAVAVALPPTKVLGFIPTPSYVLLEMTTTWRTLTRLYVLVNFATITLFTVVLMYATKHFKKHKNLLIVLSLFIALGIGIEYQAFRPFTGNKLSTFNYKTDVPEAYVWLSGQESIKVIAEYPLERAGGESNAMAYYLSMQIAHDKKLFNGNIPTTYEEDLRASLKDVSDPQTLAVLRGAGVDTVVVHGVEPEEIAKIEGLEILHIQKQSAYNILAYTPLVKNDTVVIARITAPGQRIMLALSAGFARNTNIIKSSADWAYEAINGSILKVAAIPGFTDLPTEPIRQCFEVKMSGVLDVGTLSLEIDGAKDALQANIDSTYTRIDVYAKDSIVLTNDKGFNMRVQNFGCRL
jgi:hypothetical protein